MTGTIRKLADLTERTGARRRADIPKHVLSALASGKVETVNLMEWLAADMSRLARTVAKECGYAPLQAALMRAADEMGRAGITTKLLIAGRAITSTITDFRAETFARLAEHQSDLVRQWACYAVNDPNVSLGLRRRLELTLPFAADRNMTVREAAWMAFRPHLIKDLERGVELLLPLSLIPDANVRRFTIEVSRPRSVWGAHIRDLKRRPQRCRRL